MGLARQVNLLPSLPGSSLGALGIDLGDWHEALKKSVISKPSSKGIYRTLEESTEKPEPKILPGPLLQPPLNSPAKRDPASQDFKFLYSPVDTLQAQNLTYEIFVELINKTDWYLRRLVISLEDKLARDRKYYQVEQARIRGKLEAQRR